MPFCLHISPDALARIAASGHIGTMVEPSSTSENLRPSDNEIRRGVELLYFGYSHMTRAIDADLARQGLGRAHHRALYFIARQPDISVGELLGLLAITKQALGRVLGDLLTRGLLVSRPGEGDRRRKLLSLTATGAKLERALFDALRLRMGGAYARVDADEVEGFWRVLEGLIPADARAQVAQLHDPERRVPGAIRR